MTFLHYQLRTIIIQNKFHTRGQSTYSTVHRKNTNANTKTKTQYYKTNYSHSSKIILI